MSSPTPSRWLRLTTPYVRGDDVRRLQAAVNTRTQRRGFGPTVKVDGEYGPRTRDAVRSTLWYLGCPADSLDAGATTRHQRYVLDPDRRPGSWLRIAEDRKAWQAGRFKGRDGFLELAASYVGKVEQPLGSNRGPWLDPLLEAEGWLPRGIAQGPPYCAIALMALYERVGISCGPWAYTPNWVAAARAGTLGWKVVATRSRQPGDAFFIKIPGVSRDVCDHVGVIGEEISGTIEFNTSSGNVGSQNNGGGAYRRRWADRSGMVVCVARPPWSTAR